MTKSDPRGFLSQLSSHCILDEFRRKFYITTILAVMLPNQAMGTEDESLGVHWAYSSFFGTGWYDLQDNRSVFVMRIPPRQTLQASDFSTAGEREIGIEINYPLTIGLHNTELVPDIIKSENFGTLTFTPGIELEIPMTERWYLRPFANLGWGKEFDSGETAWIYRAGIKSRYSFPSDSVEWSLLSNLYYAGHSPSKSRSQSLGGGLLGVEILQPLQKTFWKQSIDLHWHATYSFLGNELKFSNGDGTFTNVDNIVELGFAFSLRDRPFKFWLWKPERIGLGYKFSPEGDIRAVTLNFRSWFKR